VDNTSLGSGYGVSMADMEIRGSGSLFGYKQSGGGSSMGYEMYTRLIQRVLYESGNLGVMFRILPEDVVVELYKSRFIPDNYISVESVRMSIYKNLSSAASEKVLDDILYNLVDRFGPVPESLMNLFNESRLRLLAALAGIKSLVRRGCGVVCTISSGSEKVRSIAILDYIERFFADAHIVFHVLPISGDCLSLCLHFSDSEDMFSLISKFLDKFKALD
jgi:transcription-repair coupling factor (superfamily II helicase)